MMAKQSLMRLMSYLAFGAGWNRGKESDPLGAPTPSLLLCPSPNHLQVRVPYNVPKAAFPLPNLNGTERLHSHLNFWPHLLE